MTELSEKYIGNCRLLSNRHNILEHLPKNGVGAEIGVLGGDWSKHLFSMLNPIEWHYRSTTPNPTFFENDIAFSHRIALMLKTFKR